MTAARFIVVTLVGCVVGLIGGYIPAAIVLNVMMAASLAVRTQVRGKAPPVAFRRGLGVRAGGLVVSLT